MTTETENPTWGEAPPPEAAPGPQWSGRKIVIAVAIAVGIAAAGAGVIYAASNSEAAQQGMGGPRGYGGPGMMIMGPGPFGDTAHGEFQNGEITEVNDSSITVKSPDGFTKTYRVDGDTRVNGTQSGVSGLAKGDTVTLVANTDGTATSIMEGDVAGKRPDNGRRQGDGQGQPPGGQGQPPTR